MATLSAHSLTLIPNYPSIKIFLKCRPVSFLIAFAVKQNREGSGCCSTPSTLPTSLETTPAAFIQGWRGCENTGVKRAATKNSMGRERHTQR